MKTINPTTGEVLKEYAEMRPEEITGIIERANAAQKEWKGKSYGERAAYLIKMAEILQSREEELSQLMALEMGKPLAQGRAEIEKCAWVCKYYAEHAESFLAIQPILTDASKSYVSFNPLGIVLAIMPWNFPFWQLFRFLAPALMAGNGGLLKHAESVTGCALKIEEIVHDSGISGDLFRSLLIPSSKVKPIIQHKGIAAITLTGSTHAGKIVAAQAAEVLKKTVLELGGSDPYIILADANIPRTAEACATSRLTNSGQSCIAAKRFIVVEEVYDDFVAAFTKLMQAKKVGGPFDPATDVGPMARKDLRDELHQQVQKSVEMGAHIILGGELPEGNGAYYPPTVLTHVTEGMPAFEEELFGPVAAIIKVKTEEEAITIANGSQFGLGGAVFSENSEHAEDIAANKLEAGSCFVNEFVKSDPRLPFGGIKESGYGRELGMFGIREFVNIKTVYVK